jgi:hypothetical protein
MSTQVQTVRVVHGANEGYFPVRGRTITFVKRRLRDGFNIPYFAEAFVDGVPVNADHILGECALLEFVKTFGFKGGREATPEDEPSGLFWAYQPELLTIAEQVKAANLSLDQSVDMMVQLVTRWCQTKFGPLLGVNLPQVMEAVQHLNGLIQVAAEFQRCDVGGRPGRRATTEDIASFAHLRRTRKDPPTWKEIYSEWRTANPNDERITSWQNIRDAHRRYYGDKAR